MSHGILDGPGDPGAERITVYESGQVARAQVFDRSWQNEREETRNRRLRVDAATLAEL
jgi:hypothetical protein